MSLRAEAVKKWPRTKHGGERGEVPKFPIETSVSYKVLGVRDLSRVGRGRTIDISSKLVTFVPERELPAGVGLELMIKWPVLLKGSVGMELVLWGVVICGDQSANTMEIVRYQFRTKSELRETSLKKAGQEAPLSYRLVGDDASSKIPPSC
jgi:hypothetical protein